MRVTTAGFMPYFSASQRRRLLGTRDFMGLLPFLFKAATPQDREGSWLLLMLPPSFPLKFKENPDCCPGVLVWQGEEGPTKDHGAPGLVSVSVLKGTKEGTVPDPRESCSRG